MNKKISLTIISLITLLFSITSVNIQAKDSVDAHSHPSVREMTIYIERMQLEENWQQWFENYLEYFTSEENEETEPEKDSDSPLEVEDEEVPVEEPVEEDEQQQTTDNQPKEEDKQTQVPDKQPVKEDDKQQVPAKKPDKEENNEQVPDKQPDKEENNEQVPDKQPDKEENIEQPEVPDKQPEKPEEPEETVEKPIEKPSINRAAFERKVAELTNQERAAHGLDPLIFDSALSAVAKVKSNDMFENNYFAHQSPTYGSPFDMMDQFGLSYFSAAENIAAGYSTPEQVVNGWMNSPGHRANILGESYTHIGIGLADNSYHWTQMFIGR